MKTLDEVIELCEKALWCAYLPQDDTTTTAGLALYYLREYREMKEHLACLDAVALHGEDTQRVNNPALTWDELQHMDGKPVWATFDNENGTWYIAKVYEDKVVLYEWGQEFGERISGAWDYTPKRWQAYRKERS